jgi:uncharacterized protein
MLKSAQALLQDFAEQVRRPVPASDLAGLAVYQRLFINNVRLMLAQSFPVTHALLGSNQFDQWVAIFYAEHRAQTPRFTELAPEFLGFCQRLLVENLALTFGHPAQALIELLHYEWIETELALSDVETLVPKSQAAQSAVHKHESQAAQSAVDKHESQAAQSAVDKHESQAAQSAVDKPMIVLSPLARVLAYQYPVHQISAKQPPSNMAPTEPTFLLVWRDPEFEVKFQALNAASVQLLMHYQQPNAHMPADPAALEILQRWQRTGVLISDNRT